MGFFNGLVMAAGVQYQSTDPHYNNVALLLQGEGATIIDGSAHNRSAIVYGNVQTSNDVVLNSGGAIKLDGDGDYLEYADSSAFNFDDGDFTIELALRMTAYSSMSGSAILTKMRSPDYVEYAVYLFGSSSLYTTLYFDAYSEAGTLHRVAASYNFQLNTTYRIGISREGNTMKVAVNNTVIETSAFTLNIRKVPPAPVRIGLYYPGAPYFFAGYLDDYRITKGIARDLTVPFIGS